MEAFGGRREDGRFLSGQGRYSADASLPGELHAAFRRSERAHARIVSVDARRAAAAPGVRAVFTARELAGCFGTMVPAMSPEGRAGTRLVLPERPIPASDRVRFAGEEIAIVLADSAARAADAAELIEVDYEELPAVIGIEGALRDGAPLVHEEAPGNLCFDFDYGDERAVDELLAGAAHRIQVSVESPRVSAAPMEPRAALAWYDESRGRYCIRCSNQGGDLMAVQLAALLKVERSRIEVHPVDVGGGFGPRAGAYPEYALAMEAARRLGRPVRWLGTRSEDLLCDAQGRGIRIEGELGLDAQGRFLALKTQWTCDQGAYLTYAGPRTNTGNGKLIGAGPYRVEALYGRHRLVFTNTSPTDAYRGASRPEAALILERLADEAARALRMDPFELRRRNMVPREAFPYQTLTGSVLDSGDYGGLLEEARTASAWDGFAARQSASASRGALRGIGCALFVEPCGGGFVDTDEVALAFQAGRVEAFVATTANGQGHETVFPMLIAQRLGIDASIIHLRASDPGGPPIRGNGTIGSRSALAQGSAFVCAAAEAAEKGRPIAAEALEAPVQDVEFAGGRYRVRGTDLSIGFGEVMALAAGAGGPNPLDTTLAQPVPRAFTSGVHVAEVEIDLDTGTPRLASYVAVDDIGAVVSEPLAHGQIHGGLAQAAGQVFGEACRYDPDTGQLLTGSFMDYPMPKADGLPFFRSGFRPTPSPTNLLGAKGAGETGSTGGLAALMNAITDALRPAGVRSFDMPATPRRIWEALRRSGER